MQGHNFSKTLHAKGMFVYCARCGLVRLGNRATEKQVNKSCIGLRELEDEEYLRLSNMIKGRK